MHIFIIYKNMRKGWKFMKTTTKQKKKDAVNDGVDSSISAA